MIYSERGTVLLTSKLPLSRRPHPSPFPIAAALVDQLSPAAGSAEGARFLLTRNCVHLPCSHPGLASGLQPGPITPMIMYPSPPAQLSYRGMGGQNRVQGQSQELRIASGVLLFLPCASVSLVINMSFSALKTSRTSRKAFRGSLQSEVPALTLTKQKSSKSRWR